MNKVTVTSENHKVDIDYNIAFSGYSSTEIGDFILKYNTQEMTNFANEAKSVVKTDNFTYENKTNFLIPGFRKDDEPTSIELPSGVTVIFGLTNTGKSELAKRLAKASGAEFIRFHEPELPAIVSTDELFSVIYNFLESERKMLIWDSFRYFVYNFGGDSKRAAGKGGISSAMYSDLTALSLLASMLGKSIVIVINPMTDEEKDVKTIAHALEGSTAGIIQAKGYGKFNLTARTRNSLRNAVAYTFTSEDSFEFGKDEVKEHSMVMTNPNQSDQLIMANSFGRLFSSHNSIDDN